MHQGLPAPVDIGICLAAAFEELVCRRQEVGETVRFLPELLYDAEGALRGGGALGGGMVGIEEIDLKVW